jgi:hypothetical protein
MGQEDDRMRMTSRRRRSLAFYRSFSIFSQNLKRGSSILLVKVRIQIYCNYRFKFGIGAAEGCSCPVSSVLGFVVCTLTAKRRHRKLHPLACDKVASRPRFARYLDQRSWVYLGRLGTPPIVGPNAAVICWDVQTQISAVGFVRPSRHWTPSPQYEIAD